MKGKGLCKTDDAHMAVFDTISSSFGQSEMR